MVVVEDHHEREPFMSKVTTIGLDLAKNVFQVHAVDETDGLVTRRPLRRGQVLTFFAGLPPCLIGMEACATAHYWARGLRALGHEVRLMPPQYVKDYVKRNKNDAADAEAICEAVKRPSMHFVPVKTAEQQSALLMHRGRELLVRQRTMLANALRGLNPDKLIRPRYAEPIRASGPCLTAPKGRTHDRKRPNHALQNSCRSGAIHT
jgi:transposase